MKILFLLVFILPTASFADVYYQQHDLRAQEINNRYIEQQNQLRQARAMEEQNRQQYQQNQYVQPDYGGAILIDSVGDYYRHRDQ